MDLWTCQLLQVEYAQLKKQVEAGASDTEVLEWCFKQGTRPDTLQVSWWNSYIRNRGFNDDLSEKLQMRIKESGFEEKNIQTFFQYIDADEER